MPDVNNPANQGEMDAGAFTQGRNVIILPDRGLCNRLRMIASAARLAAELSWKLEMVWKWGDWTELFEPLPGTIIHHELPVEFRKLPVVNTVLFRHGGEIANQNLALPKDNVCVIRGAHCFSIQGCSPAVPARLRPYYPCPSGGVLDAVEEYIRQNWNKPTVGLHIRHTDWRARRRSPDELFIQAFRRLSAAGYQVYLSTDNQGTLKRFRDEFGDVILNRPKTHEREKRWPPRESDLVTDIRDDWIDVLLLSRCEYVLGSYISSFSETAMALNGSPKCLVLTHESLPNFNP